MSTGVRSFESIEWLFDQSNSGYLVLDAGRRATYANPALGRMLGRDSQELVGLLFEEIFPKIDSRTLHGILAGDGPPSNAGLPLGRRLNFDFTVRRFGDGHEVVVHDLAVQVRQEIELTHLKATMAVSQELLRHKNQELDRSLENMGRLNEQLAHLDNLKSEFLSNTSHELRTPLSTIIGSLQLVREGLCESRDEEQEYLATALESAQRLLEVINDVLDSAKLRAGKMNFLIEDHRVSDVFEEVYSQLHPPAKHKKLKMEFETLGSQDLMVRADFEKTKQILINLAGNAIKFTEEGEVRVSALLDPDDADLIRFTVTDTGIGIPLERQQTIFDCFTQVDGSATRRYEGTGLGLAITKNLVEMMGGTIRLRSEGTGQGTQFVFTLPIGVGGAAAAKAALRSREELSSELPMTF